MNEIEKQRRLMTQGWTVNEPSRAASIQRWLHKETGTLIDAIKLTGNRFLVLQDDALSCCKIVHVNMRDYEYRCEYQRADGATTDHDLVGRTGQRADAWRDYQLRNDDHKARGVKFYRVTGRSPVNNIVASGGYIAADAEEAVKLFKDHFEKHVCNGFFGAKPSATLWKSFEFTTEPETTNQVDFIWDRLDSKRPVHDVYSTERNKRG